MARRYTIYREPTFGEQISHEVGFQAGARLGCLRILALPLAFFLSVSCFACLWMGSKSGMTAQTVSGVVLGVLDLLLLRWILRGPRRY